VKGGIEQALVTINTHAADLKAAISRHAEDLKRLLKWSFICLTLTVALGFVLLATCHSAGWSKLNTTVASNLGAPADNAFKDMQMRERSHAEDLLKKGWLVVVSDEDAKHHIWELEAEHDGRLCKTLEAAIEAPLVGNASARHIYLTSGYHEINTSMHINMGAQPSTHRCSDGAPATCYHQMSIPERNLTIKGASDETILIIHGRNRLMCDEGRLSLQYLTVKVAAGDLFVMNSTTCLFDQQGVRVRELIGDSGDSRETDNSTLVAIALSAILGGCSLTSFFFRPSCNSQVRHAKCRCKTSVTCCWQVIRGVRDMRVICNGLGAPKSFRLLYRASRDGWRHVDLLDRVVGHGPLLFAIRVRVRNRERRFACFVDFTMPEPPAQQAMWQCRVCYFQLGDHPAIIEINRDPNRKFIGHDAPRASLLVAGRNSSLSSAAYGQCYIFIGGHLLLGWWPPGVGRAGDDLNRCHQFISAEDVSAGYQGDMDGVGRALLGGGGVFDTDEIEVLEVF